MSTIHTNVTGPLPVSSHQNKPAPHKSTSRIILHKIKEWQKILLKLQQQNLINQTVHKTASVDASTTEHHNLNNY